MAIFDMDIFEYNDWGGIDKETSRKMKEIAFQLGAFAKTYEGKNEPEDTYPIDVFFCMDFLTQNEELTHDFPVIAASFLNKEGTRISTYAKKGRLPFFGMEDETLNLSFYQRIMYLILLGAREGSGYCKELLVSLYKTYYKREYNSLKRFKTMSVTELFAFTNDKNKTDSELYAMTTRVLTMAPFLGITVEVNYAALKTIFGEFLSDHENNIRKILREASLSEEEIEEKLLDVRDMIAADQTTKNKRESYLGEDTPYGETLTFILKALEEIGYNPAVFLRQNDDFYGEELDMATTKALMDRHLKYTEATYEKIQIYAMIYYALTSFVCMHDAMSRDLDYFLGFESELPDSKFRLPVVKDKEDNMPRVERTYQEKHAKQDTTDSPEQEEETDLREQLEDALRKLHKTEADYRVLMKEKQDLKRSLAEAGVRLEHAKDEHAELIALRNHLYRAATENEHPVAAGVSVELMKERLKDKKILILGGHTNWINKLRREFPDWEYAKASILEHESKNKVESADYVYFFADTISHGGYWRFLNVLRKKNIPFGYIQIVNIESNIRQIYEDVIKER